MWSTSWKSVYETANQWKEHIESKVEEAVNEERRLNDELNSMLLFCWYLVINIY